MLEGVVRAVRRRPRILVAEVIPVIMTTSTTRGSAEALGRPAVGRRGEDIAARYLGDHGWRVLDRNWRLSDGLRGELDLVALEPAADRPPTLVVVEVKTRTGLSAGPPAAAVDTAKLGRLDGVQVENLFKIFVSNLIDVGQRALQSVDAGKFLVSAHVHILTQGGASNHDFR